MSRQALDQTLAFITALDRARNPADICAVVLETASRFGAKHVLAGTIPVPGAGRSEQQGHVVLDHLPQGWVQRYFAHDYLSKDPTIRHVLLGSPAFMWSDIVPTYGDDSTSQRIMGEAGDFGLREGFTVPLVTLEGDVAGFSLSGDRLEISPSERGMLSLLAVYALGRTLALAGAHPQPVTTLTHREIQTLQWAAEGKTEWEIGERMRISEHGANKHMRSARLKLGARNKTHAIAMAIRQGFIR